MPRAADDAQNMKSRSMKLGERRVRLSLSYLAASLLRWFLVSGTPWFVLKKPGAFWGLVSLAFTLHFKAIASVCQEIVN